jgi:hypothetical protein
VASVTGINLLSLIEPSGVCNGYKGAWGASNRQSNFEMMSIEAVDGRSIETVDGATVLR